MATVRYWQKVQVDVQSALAASQAITGITKANPGVVTYSGTDPANGDYMVLTIQGMRELNSRVVRVANVNGAANTFELEGIDTTLFTTFVATGSSMSPVTFGTSLATMLSISASGGEAELDDQTTIHDDIRVVAPTLFSAAEYAFESIWDPADAGLVALKTASDAKVQRAVRFTFADGAKLAFNGYVGATMIPTGQAPGKVTTAVKITSTGRTSFWST